MADEKEKKEKKEKKGPQNSMIAVQGYEVVDRYPSGIWGLDKVLGGGIPEGRIMGIWGDTGMGKSTLCQVLGGTLALNNRKMSYIDAEDSIDPEWAHGMGIQDTHFRLWQADYLEQACDSIRALCSTKIEEGDGDDVIVLDSATALAPLVGTTASQEDAMIGVTARVLSSFFPAVRPLLRKSKTTLIVITQLRNKIGVMYGDPLIPTGGKALPFFSSISLRMYSTEDVLRGDEKIGVRLHGKVAKNKTAPTRGNDFYFNAMWSPEPFFDVASDVLEVALAEGVFQNAKGEVHKGDGKSHIYFEGAKLGNRTETKDLLAEDLVLRELIENELHRIIHLGGNDGRSDAPPDIAETLSEAETQPEYAV